MYMCVHACTCTCRHAGGTRVNKLRLLNEVRGMHHHDERIALCTLYVRVFTPLGFLYSFPSTIANIFILCRYALCYALTGRLSADRA